MKSTMQDAPLSISRLLEHAARVHPDTEVVTATPDGTRRRTFAEVAERAGRLAGALRACGIDGDQRVGTFMWNNAEHLEVYLAVPSMGAVLHTLNIRLFPDQVTYVANHAEDKVVVVDASLLAPFAALLPTFETVTHVLVAGPEAADADLSALEATGKTILTVRGRARGRRAGHRVARHRDETDAAAMCYTSGTTGNPKGVAYSHRSMYLHSMAVAMGDAIGADAVRPDPADRADVPRQRLGPAVRRDHGRRRDGDAGPMAPVRAADAADRGRAGDRLGGRPDDLERHPHLRRRARGRPLVHPARAVRRLRGAPGAAAGAARAARRRRCSRLGHDRDQSRSRRSRCRPSGSTPDSDEGWRYRASQGRVARRRHRPDRRRRRPGAPPRRRRGRRDRGTRSVGHCLLLQRTTSPGEVPTTGGCAPATSAPSTGRASSPSPTGPRTSSSPAASGSPRSTWRTT